MKAKIKVRIHFEAKQREKQFKWINEQKFRAIDDLLNVCETMAFPISREQAICMITLVFHKLHDEWQYYGPEKVLDIIRTSERLSIPKEKTLA